MSNTLTPYTGPLPIELTMLKRFEDGELPYASSLVLKTLERMRSWLNMNQSANQSQLPK